MTLSRNLLRPALVFAAIGAGAPAGQAADYLRGAYGGHVEPKSAGIDWAGVYGGVSAGFTAAQTDFQRVGRTVGERVLPNLAITDQVAAMVNMGQSRKQGFNYGAFIGVNYLWDDVVLGFEADYSRSSIAARGQFGPQTRTFAAASTGTDAWVTTVSANARSRLRDWGTIRGRVGWAAGWFMPYITAGIALGNIESVANGTGTTVQNAVTTDPITNLPVLTPRGPAVNGTTTVKHRGISYGGAIGAGIDMAFFSNVFLRAEWQYIQFASGGSRPEMAINTARVAGAVKF